MYCANVLIAYPSPIQALMAFNASNIPAKGGIQIYTLCSLGSYSLLYSYTLDPLPLTEQPIADYIAISYGLFISRGETESTEEKNVRAATKPLTEL